VKLKRSFPVSDFRWPAWKSRAAFTLIEIMVVVVMLAVIILGLAAMFTQVQRAFRAGMTQTDVLEGGRVATEMIARELEQVTPSYAPGYLTSGKPTTNFNFFKYMVSDAGNYQLLAAGTTPRTNILDDVFFLLHQNQTWTGVGYFVRANFTDGLAVPGQVGTLYRFETSCSAAQFAQIPDRLFYGFSQAELGRSPANVSKIMDGIIHFRVRAYDTNGLWIVPPLGAPNRYFYRDPNIVLFAPLAGLSDPSQFNFYSNAVPAFLEFELGVLEQHAYDRYLSIPSIPGPNNPQDVFLRNQAGRVHLFRQRVGVRNVDPAAYQ
jgi:type II secretory pathway pseudopilin PulG